jgi:hypothetical protein
MTLALGASPKATRALDTSARAGHLSADLGFDHGRLLPGGALQWNAPVAITDADGTQQRGRGQLDASVQPQAIDVHIRVPPPVGKRHFHLLHARDWYQSQPDLIPPQATATHGLRAARHSTALSVLKATRCR